MKDVTSLLTQWSYVFHALTHQYVDELYAKLYTWTCYNSTCQYIEHSYLTLIGPWKIYILFLKIQFSILFNWLVSSDLLIIMPPNECHLILLMIANICSGNDLVLSGNMLSPEPMWTQTYVTVWHHKAILSSWHINICPPGMVALFSLKLIKIDQGDLMKYDCNTRSTGILSPRLGR